MKGASLNVTLQELGVAASFSRPSNSNDNPFSESLFRTLKYRPSYPTKPFDDVSEARRWVEDFVEWYNRTHQHSAINFVTPEERHTGKELEVLNQRRRVYKEAKVSHPQRWARGIRNCEAAGAIYLNPAKRSLDRLCA